VLPLTLKLRNFLSYRDNAPTLHLEDVHVACLCGANGHGKSALLDAMTWALWGNARGLRQHHEPLLHQGQQEMSVELEFEARGQRYRVVRRYAHGPRQGASSLELSVAAGDGYQPITANTMAATQTLLQQLISMDYDTFVNSAFLVQGRADLFTMAKPSERKEVLAKVLGLPQSHIRVIATPCGGGFGGKCDPFQHEMIVSKLAMVTGRPVKICLTREEVFYAHRGRHPVLMATKTGFKKDGSITAMHHRTFLDGGAYGGHGVASTFYTGVLQPTTYTMGCYKFDAVRVFTNKAPCGPKRGHGTPQPRFAQEVQMDKIAEQLDMDPAELRKQARVDSAVDADGGAGVVESFRRRGGQGGPDLGGGEAAQHGEAMDEQAHPLLAGGADQNAGAQLAGGVQLACEAPFHFLAFGGLDRGLGCRPEHALDRIVHRGGEAMLLDLEAGADRLAKGLAEPVIHFAGEGPGQARRSGRGDGPFSTGPASSTGLCRSP